MLKKWMVEAIAKDKQRVDFSSIVDRIEIADKKFVRQDLNRSNFSRETVSGVHYSDCLFSNMTIRGVDFENCVFVGSVFFNVIFEDCSFVNSRFSDCSVEMITFQNCGFVDNTEFLKNGCTTVSFRECYFENIKFVNNIVQSLSFIKSGGEGEVLLDGNVIGWGLLQDCRLTSFKRSRKNREYQSKNGISNLVIEGCQGLFPFC